MAKRATLSDIAREVGLSVSTVSRVVNGKPCRISPAARDRILVVAEQHRYQPNRIARGLVSRRSDTFGLIVPSIESRLYTSLIDVLENRCRSIGCGLFITNSGDTCGGDIELVDRLAARGVDGMFIVPSFESYESEGFREALCGAGVPCVLASRTVADSDFDQVLYDHELGGYEATCHLIENGHRAIGCVANMQSSNTGRGRVRGYLRAMREAGLETDLASVVQSSYTLVSGYAAGQKLLGRGLTAVFAGSDYIALGLRKAFAEEGLVTPEDYSIVTFDRSESDFLFDPPMTAVIQDMECLGSKLFDVMQNRLADPEGARVQLLLKPELVYGETVRRVLL